MRCRGPDCAPKQIACAADDAGPPSRGVVVGLAAGGPATASANEMHSVDYSTLVRLADWRRRPATVWGLLVAWASGGRAKCRGCASVPTATARRAAELANQHHKHPSLATGSRGSTRGGGCFSGDRRSSASGASPPYLTRHAIFRATTCWEARNRELALDRSTTVKRRCTPTRPQKRGFAARGKRPCIAREQHLLYRLASYRMTLGGSMQPRRIAL